MSFNAANKSNLEFVSSINELYQVWVRINLVFYGEAVPLR